MTNRRPLPGSFGPYVAKLWKQAFGSEIHCVAGDATGMIPVMVIGRNKLESGNDPLDLLFWAIYGMAAIAGFITAYAVNWWLVRNGLKHGIMAKDADPSAEIARTHADALAEAAATGDGPDKAMGDMQMDMGGGVSTAKKIGVLALTMAFLAASWFGTSTVVPLTF